MRITNSIKKSVLSVLLVAVFLLTGVSPLAANSFGNFTVELQVDAGSRNLSSSDLSNIKIDIYESTLDRFDTTIGAYIYAHNYSYSVYTKSDGSITFSKPSEYFLVIVDLTTLPAGVGIDKDTVFYSDALKKSDALILSSIADVKISCDSSAEYGVRVDIFNADGAVVKAYYTVTPDTTVNTRNAFTWKSQLSGYVVVGSIVQRYTYTVENTGDPIEFVADALKAGNISKEEALDFFLEFYDSKAFGFCATALLMQLTKLYENTAFFNHLPIAKQEALETIVSPSKTRVPQTYTGTYFVINYDDAEFTLSQVIAVHSAFIETYNFYVNPATSSPQLRFDKPVSSIGGSTFTINLKKTVGLAHGGFLPNYIEFYIDPSRINSATGVDDQAKAVAAHEYNHAILHNYRNLWSMPGWVGDAFASWSSYRQYGTAGSDDSASFNSFLSSPNSSLPLQNHYGASLFPLYMQLYKGGDTTIKMIFSCLKAYPASDIYQVITMVTSSGILSGGFKGTFADFWVANYVPKTTYAPYATGPMVSSPGGITAYSSPSFAYGVSDLACRYISFSVTPSSTINVTLSVFGGTPSDLRNFVVLGLSNGALLCADLTSYIGTMVSVIIPAGIYTSGSIASVNVGQSSMIGCQITIS